MRATILTPSQLQAPTAIDLSRLDGYIVDATGYIKQESKLEYVFVATKIRPVPRYLSVQSLSYCVGGLSMQT
jgi:hypothetical protein